jgi:hypothetical protein
LALSGPFLTASRCGSGSPRQRSEQNKILPNQINMNQYKTNQYGSYSKQY